MNREGESASPKEGIAVPNENVGDVANSDLSTHQDSDPEGNKEVTSKDMPKQLTISQKLGIAAVCCLSVGSIVILGALGFLWFLWLAGATNPTWKSIVTKGWINRTVVLLALVIRQSVSFQATVATGMLACLALERAIVLMLNLASVSLTRNSNSGPVFLTWWLWKAFLYDPARWRKLFLPAASTILLCTTWLTQLTSFALISDISLRYVGRLPLTSHNATNFQFNKQGTIPIFTYGSSWSLTPLSYAVFGEYHEAPRQDLPDGVQDTGLTMRAFLPVADPTARSVVASWDGRANVLDARVLCARPKLIDPRIHLADTFLALNASCLPDVARPDELGLYPVRGYEQLAANMTFACIVPLSADPINNSSSDGLADETPDAAATQWRLVMCQPEVADYLLQSELKPSGQMNRSTLNYSYGTAYVVLNVSSGTNDEWTQVIPSEDPGSGTLEGSGWAPLAYSTHGVNNEWYDLIYSEDGRLNLSVTICYTAFDTADLNVQIEAGSSHSDISPAWNSSSQTFDYTDIRVLLGQLSDGPSPHPPTSNQSILQRHAMRLTKRETWVPQAESNDYVFRANDSIFSTSWITDYANMAGSRQYIYPDLNKGPNYASILWDAVETPNVWDAQLSYIFADSSLRGLTQEILQTGGSIAFATQSVVTMLTQTSYYQQIWQMNDISNITAVNFVLVSAPDKVRGLIAVTVVLFVHLVCVFGVLLPLFLWNTTNLSTLGNAWQVVGQLLQDKTLPVLKNATLQVDSVAEQVLKKPTGSKGKLKNQDVVGLKLSRDGQAVEIFEPSKAYLKDVETAKAPTSPRVEAQHQEDGGMDEAPNEESNLLQQDLGENEDQNGHVHSEDEHQVDQTGQSPTLLQRRTRSRSPAEE